MVLKPNYLRYILILVGLVFLSGSLYVMGGIIVPFAFSGLLAILVNPINEWMLRKRVPRLLAICLTVLMAIIVVSGLMFFLIMQMAQFSDALPTLQKRYNEYMTDLQGYVGSHWHIPYKKQLEYLNKGTEKALGSGGDMAVTALSAISDMAITLTLVPVYVFLFLLYKPNLVLFIRQIFSKSNDAKVGEILTEVKTVVQAYITGLLIEAVIVAAMNVGGLLILGIPYALLLGVIGALLNMIPYIGGIIAIALPMLVAVVSMEHGLSSAFFVIIAYIIIQFIDNNLIQPKVVASKVRINALFSIVGVLAGNLLWGVGGMFLSIPIIAVLKIIFDRVEDLKPWGMLLGDTIPGVDKDHSLENKRKTVVKK